MILGSLVALGMAVTACSSDGSDGSDADETTTPSEAPAASSAPTDPPDTEAPVTDPPTSEAPTTDASTPPVAEGAAFDGTFGTDGVLASPQSAAEDDRFISVVQGPDGLIYTAGFTSAGDDHMFAVSRYTADGAPDATFGEGGTAAINVTEGGGGAEVGRGLVVQDDGMVLVAGPFEKDPTAEGDAADDLDIAVIRLDATGTPDATFGEDGIARIDLGAGKTVDDETYITDNVWGLTAREGGYAVFAVTPNQDADRTDADYAIVGLTDTGALDDTFGDAGVVIADIDASGDNARTIGTSADGSLLATGYSRDGDGVVSPVLIKVSAQGVLDESFGTGGIANHIILPGVTESYQWVAQGDNYVLAGYGRVLRPEEVHRASSEDDVVPPSSSWDHAMEQQASIVRPLIAHVHRERLTAVGARRFDATIDMQRSADTERIPRTVRIPPTVVREHPIGGRNRRERVGHPDLASVRLQHQCMLIVQPLPTGPHVVRGRAGDSSDVVDCRRMTQLDELPVRQVTERNIVVVHHRTVPRGR